MKGLMSVNLQHIKLVIFDMDGTMLDTEPLSQTGWRKSLDTQGITITDEYFAEVFDKIIGTNSNTWRRVLAESFEGFDVDLGATHSMDYMDEYMNTNGVPVKPGVFELLDKLEELGIKKCVATSTGRERARKKLKDANILHRFETVIGGDDVVESKPNPEIFLKAASACNTEPAYCLVLEDSAAGTAGGYNAGMNVIVIPDILPPTEKMVRMADEIVESLHDVVNML